MAGSWFSKMIGANLTLDSLQGLLIEQLKDLYSAETQLIDALPKMAEAAKAALSVIAAMIAMRAC